MQFVTLVIEVVFELGKFLTKVDRCWYLWNDCVRNKATQTVSLDSNEASVIYTYPVHAICVNYKD